MLLTYQTLENVDMISAFKEVLGFIRDKLHNQSFV